MMVETTSYLTVPWVSTMEWTFARDALFSGIPSAQRRAIDRIDAWRCRSPRSLPVSIISTVDLMRLALADAAINRDAAGSSSSSSVAGNGVDVDDTHLRLAYSMAIVRFVNLSTGEFAA